MKQLIPLLAIMAIFCNNGFSQPCTSPAGDEITYGTNDTWRGYVYDNPNFTQYRGFVTEGSAGNPNFDQSFGGATTNYATSSCTVSTTTFSVRYKLTKTFANASYEFTVGADDGYRLSIDGGATWIIDRWVDQGYNTTIATVALNGTYNLVLEYYENSGDNRISFSMATSCAGTENTTTYGSTNTWLGYLYDGTNFNTYKGRITQGTPANINFDQNFGGSNTMFSTSGCSVQTETFSVRYRLTKTFTNGNYSFTLGGDDGYRFSLDGGNTWVINRWNDQSYTTSLYTTNLNGTYNMVIEFYENSGDNRISFAMQSNTVLKIDLLSFAAKKENNAVRLNWEVSSDSDPSVFDIERSADGISFTKIASVAGNSGVNNTYAYNDASPLNANSYYRLRMTDENGKITYSTIAVVYNNTTAAELRIMPTVVESNTLFCKTNKTIVNAAITITDLNGRVVYKEAIGRMASGQTTGISFTHINLAKGMYVAVLQDGNDLLLTQKIIKK